MSSANIAGTEVPTHEAISPDAQPSVPPALTAAGFYYVISGQHKYRASQLLKGELEAAGIEVPGFCKAYRCSVLREGLTPTEVKETAGRYQSRSQTVHSMTFSETCDLLLNEAQERWDENGNWPPRTELLKSVYLMSGKTPVVDGDVVRFLPLRSPPQCMGSDTNGSQGKGALGTVCKT